MCSTAGMGRRDIEERVFRLALATLRWARATAVAGVDRDAIRQMVRATTSVGAHLEEARGAESKADFVHKVAAARKEAFEALYWARLLIADRTDGRLGEFCDELDQVAAILTAIVRRSRQSGRVRDRRTRHAGHADRALS